MKKGFTIVELLVVIVVIGILATITIISYTGISSKAVASALQSDLSSAKKQLSLYYVDHGFYPTTIDVTTKCPKNSGGTDDNKYCIKPSNGNIFTYTSSSPYSNFSLTNTNNNTIYTITNDSGPTAIPTVTIGTQTWMQYNLNVGIMVTGATEQTNNSTLEKWCYNNDSSNCNIYGGLYQWGETVQYQDGASNTTSPSPAFSGNVQGITPAGFHIPTDTEYKTLEVYLGMTQVDADGITWRGTTQGDQLKSSGLCSGRTPCGSSGYNMLPGSRAESGLFIDFGSYGGYWYSYQNDASGAWTRTFRTSVSQVYRQVMAKSTGISVRAIKN